MCPRPELLNWIAAPGASICAATRVGAWKRWVCPPRDDIHRVDIAAGRDQRRAVLHVERRRSSRAPARSGAGRPVSRLYTSSVPRFVSTASTSRRSATACDRAGLDLPRQCSSALIERLVVIETLPCRAEDGHAAVEGRQPDDPLLHLLDRDASPEARARCRRSRVPARPLPARGERVGEDALRHPLRPATRCVPADGRATTHSWQSVIPAAMTRVVPP